MLLQGISNFVWASGRGREEVCGSHKKFIGGSQVIEADSLGEDQLGKLGKEEEPATRSRERVHKFR